MPSFCADLAAELEVKPAGKCSNDDQSTPNKRLLPTACLRLVPRRGTPRQSRKALGGHRSWIPIALHSAAPDKSSAALKAEGASQTAYPASRNVQADA